MIKRFLAFLISLVMGATNISLFSLEDIANEFAESVFGMPFTDNAFDDNFFSSIKPESYIITGSSTGLVKNKLVLILNPEENFFKKISVLKSENIKLIGWAAISDIYVADCKGTTEDEITSLCEKLEAYPQVLKALPMTLEKTENAFIPDDPFDFNVDLSRRFYWTNETPRGSNWGLEAVYASEAWNYQSYFKDVVLGVVDDGFLYKHPDLDGKVYFPSANTINKNIEADHGTHVAGIISAKLNNNEGISGICPTAKLVCADWMPDGEYGQRWNTTLEIIFDIVRVVRAGARAVNMSFGMSAAIPENANTLRSPGHTIGVMLASYVMASMLSKGHDFIAVQAAGNGNSAAQAVDARNSSYYAGISKSNCFKGFYKVSVDDILGHIIIVGSAANSYNGKFTLASTSNQGPEVEIAAPGANIYSTVTYGYGYMSGTSMAAPFVTGVAGLILSISPKLTGKQVKEIILNNTSRVAAADYGENYIGNYEPRDLNLVNAKLCVEAALVKTYNMSKVSGKVTIASDYSGGIPCTLKCGDFTMEIAADNTFSFVIPAGKNELKLIDEEGNVVYTESIEAAKNGQVTLNCEIKDEEPDEEETTDSDAEILTTPEVINEGIN